MLEKATVRGLSFTSFMSALNYSGKLAVLRANPMMYQLCLDAANLKEGEIVHCLIIPGHLWPVGGA